jgi:four helix bundle protein
MLAECKKISSMDISRNTGFSISIASNIAEGTSRRTAKDQAHFSTIAYSSTIELLNDLHYNKRFKFFIKRTL